jgi:hypothetical protein
MFVQTLNRLSVFIIVNVIVWYGMVWYCMTRLLGWIVMVILTSHSNLVGLGCNRIRYVSS